MRPNFPVVLEEWIFSTFDKQRSPHLWPWAIGWCCFTGRVPRPHADAVILEELWHSAHHRFTNRDNFCLVLKEKVLLPMIFPAIHWKAPSPSMLSSINMTWFKEQSWNTWNIGRNLSFVIVSCCAWGGNKLCFFVPHWSLEFFMVSCSFWDNLAMIPTWPLPRHLGGCKTSPHQIFENAFRRPDMGRRPPLSAWSRTHRCHTTSSPPPPRVAPPTLLWTQCDFRMWISLLPSISLTPSSEEVLHGCECLWFE